MEVFFIELMEIKSHPLQDYYTINVNYVSTTSSHHN